MSVWQAPRCRARRFTSCWRGCPPKGCCWPGHEAGEGAREAIELFIKELRYTSLSISGGDLLELGLKESPEVGRVLTQVKLLKLEGKVDGRDSEMSAARQILNKIKGHR